MAVKPINILYLHGMGGGGDSRIPRLLKEQMPGIGICIRTYSFDPEKAAGEIASWVEELHPDLVIGESLGAFHALRLKGFPHLLVSPSLGAAKYLYSLAFLTLIPGFSRLCGRIWHPKEGDRQRLDFTYRTLRKYRAHEQAALDNAPSAGGKDSFFAFFGSRDHYRRSGVVSIRRWERYFGRDYVIYEGSHFMEDEYIPTFLIPKIREILHKTGHELPD